MDNPTQKWLLTLLKRIVMVRESTPSQCIMCKCGLEPLHFNWFRPAVRLYNALNQSTTGNSSTARKTLQADMQLNSQCDDCWSSHILSAMNLIEWSDTILHVQREAAATSLRCEPIDLSRFVVDLRERHLTYWAHCYDTHPQEHRALQRGPWSCVRHTSDVILEGVLPRFMFLDLPQVIIHPHTTS